MKTYNLEISGGLGPSVGLVRKDVLKDVRNISFTVSLRFLSFQVLRVGLMGCNSSKTSVDMVLAALKDALKHCHKSKV